MANHPSPIAELVSVVTRGDVILDTPLAKVGGKGLSVKGLGAALLGKHVDIAVHPIKDMPVELSNGLRLITTCEREDPRDIFVSNKYNPLDKPPTDSVVETSSSRRQCQLAKRRLDLVIRPLHDNAGTRFSKLDNGDYDATILTIAGLKRLGLESRVCIALPSEVSLPTIGQGIVGIECQLDDMRTQALLTPLSHEETVLRVKAERAMNTRLEGGCQVPISSYTETIDGEIWLCALVDTPNGSQMVCRERRDAIQDAEQIGISLTEELLESDACAILAEVCSGEAPA